MKLRNLVLTAFALTSLTIAHAADLAGKWTAEFDSPIGVQKYGYEFKVEGDKLTGKANFDNSMGKGESPLQEIKVTGDSVSFVETRIINDMPVKVTYVGKISGDEIKLTREVGDYGTQQLVAKRVKAEAKSEPKPAGK